MKILLLSDIHANFPALASIYSAEKTHSHDMIIHCGDSTVYATFPGATLNWLKKHKAVNILGNTDIKVLKLLRGSGFKKPKKAEKRIMYTWTAAHLAAAEIDYLASLPLYHEFTAAGRKIGVYHGSPANPNEQLFASTPSQRFEEIGRKSDRDIILCGHSHTPFHKKIRGVHFINPGSVGRMFDGDPRASYAVLEIDEQRIRVRHFRRGYDIEETVRGITEALLPPIYGEMYRLGRKLN